MGVTRTKSRKRLGRRHPGKKFKEPGVRKNRCFREKIVSVRLLPSSQDGWHQYDTEVVPKTPAHQGLVRFRKSTRWCDGSTARAAWRHIPFIDYSGHIHSISLARWRCTPPQLLATITSTVFKRLWGRTRRISPKLRPTSDLLGKVALIYAITNDDSFFRRTLSMIQHHKRELGKFVYYKIQHLDANNRFLYDQASYGALWFQSRVDLCPRRAMSNLTIEVKRNDGNLACSGRCHFDRLVVNWARVYSGASAHPKRVAVASPHGKRLLIFRGNP